MVRTSLGLNREIQAILPTEALKLSFLRFLKMTYCLISYLIFILEAPQARKFNLVADHCLP